jgi:hypothetical protein
MSGRRAARWVAIWTSVWLVVLAVFAFQTLGGLYVAGQRCFFGSSATACPTGPDATAIISLGFVGIPLLWLSGIVAFALVSSRRRRDRGDES